MSLITSAKTRVDQQNLSVFSDVHKTMQRSPPLATLVLILQTLAPVAVPLTLRLFDRLYWEQYTRNAYQSSNTAIWNWKLVSWFFAANPRTPPFN
jgi:hypothetical protein